MELVEGQPLHDLIPPQNRHIDGHILYFSKRRIQAGQELLLDYNFRKAPALAL